MARERADNLSERDAASGDKSHNSLCVPSDPSMAIPRFLLTPGDVAGIGPEIVARAWPALVDRGTPVVVGDVGIMRKATALVRSDYVVKPVLNVASAAPHAGVMPVIQATEQNLSHVIPGQVTAEAGRAAYDFLCRAIDLTLAGEADALVTGPLHKEQGRGVALSWAYGILASEPARHYAMVLCNNIAVSCDLGILARRLREASRRPEKIAS